MLAPSQRGTAMPSETTEHNNSLLSFELPLMYIESGRSLVQLYTSFRDLSALGRLRHGVEEVGQAVKSLYAY
jgi:hypothetical protein